MQQAHDNRNASTCDFPLLWKLTSSPATLESRVRVAAVKFAITVSLVEDDEREHHAQLHRPLAAIDHVLGRLAQRHPPRPPTSPPPISRHHFAFSHLSRITGRLRR